MADASPGQRPRDLPRASMAVPKAVAVPSPFPGGRPRGSAARWPVHLVAHRRAAFAARLFAPGAPVERRPGEAVPSRPAPGAGGTGDRPSSLTCGAAAPFLPWLPALLWWGRGRPGAIDASQRPGS